MTKDCKEAVAADKALERATLLESVERIREECFSGGSVKVVNISANTQSIGEKVFYQCRNLKKVIFAADSQLRVIKAWTFCGCVGLKHISLPESIEEML